MFDAFAAIAERHNLLLVMLAGLVGLIASGTALRMMVIGGRSGQANQTFWLLFAGACGGAGAWATHFIAILAYDPGVGVGYDLLRTALSLAIALVFACAAMQAAARVPAPWKIPAWGLTFCLGVAAMHYTGMWAMQAAGRQHWNLALAALSLPVGGAFSMLGLWLVERRRGARSFACGTLCLALAVCGVHAIGMAAVVFTPDPTIVVAPGLLSHQILAFLVGALTSLIVVAALITLWIEATAQRASVQLLRSVIEVMPQGLAYYDAQDRLMLSNESYLRGMASLGKTARVGETFRQMLERAAAEGGVSQAAGREQAWVAERLRAWTQPSDGSDRVTADGRVLRVEYIRTTGGGIVTVVSDITALTRQADDLAAARDQAEAAAQAKTKFLANMSHELRTPMNGVLGVADLLAREPLTARQVELVDLIRASGGALNRVLCDVLDLANAESGPIELRLAPFDLQQAVEGVFALGAVKAKDKGLAMRSAFDPAVTGDYIGDPARLKQILGNLIGNAVKFTEHGFIELAVAPCEEGVRFTVADSGIGFDAAVAQRLFGRFEQADDSITRRYGGSGLGLAISRELATSMGGSLTCQAEPNVGAVFTLVLPLERCAPAASASVDIDDPHLPAARMLVVDDNATNRRVLGLMLNAAGMEATFAEDGRQALGLWEASPFDAVLMDIQMPVMDGLAATSAIRAREAEQGRPRTPIIMVSANAMPEHIQASHAAGADDHVAKPVSPQVLFSAIGRLADPGAAQTSSAA